LEHLKYKPWAMPSSLSAFATQLPAGQWTAQLRDTFLTAQTIQHNADLLLGTIAFACLTFDVFDDALAGRGFTLSPLSVHENEDEPKVSLSPDLNLRHRR
jgi:hypothetical protein